MPLTDKANLYSGSPSLGAHRELEARVAKIEAAIKPLRFYDTASDEYRAPTQDDLDTLVHDRVRLQEILSLIARQQAFKV